MNDTVIRNDVIRDVLEQIDYLAQGIDALDKVLRKLENCLDIVSRGDPVEIPGKEAVETTIDPLANTLRIYCNQIDTLIERVSLMRQRLQL